MGYGVWGMGYGMWGVGHGAWGMGYGVWRTGYGVWGKSASGGRHPVNGIRYREVKHSNLASRQLPLPQPNDSSPLA
jgi:hypothetical protein